MGKTRDLFKKIRDAKGTFHARMDTIKDRNSMDLSEAEEIKKLRKSTEPYKKGLSDPENCGGVATHLEPDVLECEVEWALGSKAFLSLLATLWNCAFKWVYLSLSPLPLAFLLFSAICKVPPGNYFAMLHFFFP